MTDATRPALLVVDDEADLLATYRRLFGREGFRVVTAASRAAALDALAREAFVAVVAEAHLADGDGLDVVRAARGRMPAIVVARKASSHARRAARDAGAAAYVTKPFETAALAARVRALADGWPGAT
jgi:DNA-binding response OmpR family regulator